jgi:hypothetical protein
MLRHFFKIVGLFCVSLSMFSACHSPASSPGGSGSGAVLSSDGSAGATSQGGGTSGSTGGAGGEIGTNDAGVGGSTGEQSCAESRSALLTKIQQSTACVAATDCMEYDAPCLQQESGNCAGIFYIAKSQKDPIDSLESAYSTCAGNGCGAGGSCGLGGLPPACVQGTCSGQHP